MNRFEIVTMSHFLAITFVFLPAIVGITNCVNAFANDPLFEITAKRGDDKVEVKPEDDKVTFLVQSPFGISQAVIERCGNNWPKTVLLRLHLKGLEKFKVSNGKTTLAASVSSQDAKVRVWKDGREGSPLDSKHPCWMKIRMVNRNGDRATKIPLTGGFFEMQLPRALMEDNPKSITLDWIDFYR